MPPVVFAADEYRYALDYCAATARELIEFTQYFQGSARYPAVDTAVLNIVRMRIEILNEQLDTVEKLAPGRIEIIDELLRTSTTCCDFMLKWAPHLTPIVA